MKNIKREDVKKCIYLDFEEYENLTKSLYSPKLNIENNEEGLTYNIPDSDLSYADIEYAIIEKLSKYYDVNVIGIHIDDNYPCAGVWLEFTETSTTVDVLGEVNVNKGKLGADTTHDSNNPGICIYYETNNGDIIDIARAEVKSENVNGDIDVYVFEDVYNEDYTRKFTLLRNEIAKAINS